MYNYIIKVVHLQYKLLAVVIAKSLSTSLRTRPLKQGFLAVTTHFESQAKRRKPTKEKSAMFHNQTAQFVSVVAQNLPEMSDDIMQGWIENPRGLQKFLSGLNPPQDKVELKVFKTIKLGTGIQDADGFRKAIKAKDK